MLLLISLNLCYLDMRAESGPVGKCPSKDGELPVYLPDASDCSLFYECSNGVPNQKECLPGLCFDPKLNVCAFAPKQNKGNNHYVWRAPQIVSVSLSGQNNQLLRYSLSQVMDSLFKKFDVFVLFIIVVLVLCLQRCILSS